MKKILLILLGILFEVSGWAAEQQTWYAADEQVDGLPIIVPVGANAKPIYVASAWGLLIESITCDSKLLVLVREGGVVEEEARYVVKVSGTYVYTCRVPGLLFTSRAKSGDVTDDVVAYEIPVRWSNLVITYRARFADGTFSDLREARFSRLSHSEMAQAAAEFAKSHGREK